VLTPEQAIDAVNQRYGQHAGFRALHAKGLVCGGTFTATPQAAALTRAAHLSGVRTPVLARLSNGGGDPTVPDYAPDVRGLAVSFELPDGKRTVISAQTVPLLSVGSPDAFIALIAALHPRPSQAWRLPLFLARNPRVAASLPASLRALKLPASYAAVTYHGLHSFRWLAADGSDRFVRYTWVPEAGDHRISGSAGKRAGRDYLSDELRARLAGGPVRFTLQVQIAGAGDNPDDPTVAWPSSRDVVTVGTLELTELVTEPAVLVFDPTALTDGIELSNDPILKFRAGAYSVSVERRLH
jgi:catalase